MPNLCYTEAMFNDKERIMETIVSRTAYCKAWGSGKNARRVHGLSKSEKVYIQEGGTVLMQNAPEYKGTTFRRIVKIGSGYYARMPKANITE